MSDIAIPPDIKSVIVPLSFEWIVSGINNGLPVSYLGVGNGDYVAKIYNSVGDGQWCAIVNMRGTRNFPSMEAAKAFVEGEIKQAVENRVGSAFDTMQRYTSLHVQF